jgi:hypothetical protein
MLFFLKIIIGYCILRLVNMTIDKFKPEMGAVARFLIFIFVDMIFLTLLDFVLVNGILKLTPE